MKNSFRKRPGDAHGQGRRPVKSPEITQWRKGPVDCTEEHFELRYGSAPVAVVGLPIAGIVNVQFLFEPDHPRNAGAVREVAREIQFYLIDKGEPKPWEYAKYHCGASANVYSKVHWSFSEPTGKRAASNQKA